MEYFHRGKRCGHDVQMSCPSVRDHKPRLGQHASSEFCDKKCGPVQLVQGDYGLAVKLTARITQPNGALLELTIRKFSVFSTLTSWANGVDWQRTTDLRQYDFPAALEMGSGTCEVSVSQCAQNVVSLYDNPCFGDRGNMAVCYDGSTWMTHCHCSHIRLGVVIELFTG